MEFTGQTALVTGASSGIGVGYARELAARGADLILVARREGKLEELAADLRAKHGVKVEVVAADLIVPGAAQDVADRVEALGTPVDILVNNAGYGMHGRFADADADRLTGQVLLNCVAVVDLTRRFLPGMIARRRGAVINIASTAALQPVPYMAVYGATKAFVLSFGEALWAEAKPAGVTVLTVCPGATETPFFEVVGTDDAAVGSMRTVEQVVATTLAGLRKGGPTVIDGVGGRALSILPRLFPRKLVVTIAERLIRPRTPKAA